MNERFVAVSTVMGSRIHGCFSKPRCDFIVTRGWQRRMNAIGWIKQFAEKIAANIHKLSSVDDEQLCVLYLFTQHTDSLPLYCYKASYIMFLSKLSGDTEYQMLVLGTFVAFVLWKE